MIDLAKVIWYQPPKTRPGVPFIYEVYFAAATFDYVVDDRAWGFVEDKQVIQQCRRAARRALRKIVQAHGHVPRELRERPFWWTPKTPLLVVQEVVGLRAPGLVYRAGR